MEEERKNAINEDNGHEKKEEGEKETVSGNEQQETVENVQPSSEEKEEADGRFPAEEPKDKSAGQDPVGAGQLQERTQKDETAENGQAPINEEEQEGKKKKEKKKRILGKVRKIIFIILFCFLLLAFIALNIVCGSYQSEIDSLSSKNSKLESQVDNLESQVNTLQEKNDELSSKNDQLSQENDQLKNGASAQLVEIKNAYEAGNWQDTIDKYNKLHKQYNGSEEDKEAKKLADDAQKQLDAEQEAAAEKEAKGYETGITYDQLARTPDDYTGEKVKFSGKVIQVIEGDNETQLRIAVNDDYDTVLFAVYESDIVSSRVLEDDEITIYGVSMGNLTYQSTMGGKITIPAVSVDKIDQ